MTGRVGRRKKPSLLDRSGLSDLCGRHATLFLVAGLLGPGISVTAYLGIQEYPYLKTLGISPGLLVCWFLGGIACALLGTVLRAESRDFDTLSLECFAVVLLSLLFAVPLSGSFFLFTWIMNR